MQETLQRGYFGATRYFSQSLVKLTALLQRGKLRIALMLHFFIRLTGLGDGYSTFAMEWLLANPGQSEVLLKASRGHYDVIVGLVETLKDGISTKNLVDKVIDSCKFLICFYV